MNAYFWTFPVVFNIFSQLVITGLVMSIFDHLVHIKCNHPDALMFIVLQSKVSAFLRSTPFNWGSNFSNITLNHLDLVLKIMNQCKKKFKVCLWSGFTSSAGIGLRFIKAHKPLNHDRVGRLLWEEHKTAQNPWLSLRDSPDPNRYSGTTLFEFLNTFWHRKAH